MHFIVLFPAEMERRPLEVELLRLRRGEHGSNPGVADLEAGRYLA